jgi:predicted acetyltransferase
MDRLANIFHWNQPPPAAGAFAFLEPGVLVDDDLELIEPNQFWIDEILRAVAHPLTLSTGEDYSSVTRPSLTKFVAAAPHGHENGDPAKARVPTYHFWMHLDPQSRPPIPIAGTISLRVGSTSDIQLYLGNLGYGVYPPTRGRRLAERACRLLLPLARRHGLNPVWITTDPENQASRRTCERLGGRLVEIVDVPEEHPMYKRGARRKCRYRIDA